MVWPTQPVRRGRFTQSGGNNTDTTWPTRVSHDGRGPSGWLGLDQGKRCKLIKKCCVFKSHVQETETSWQLCWNWKLKKKKTYPSIRVQVYLHSGLYKIWLVKGFCLKTSVTWAPVGLWVDLAVCMVHTDERTAKHLDNTFHLLPFQCSFTGRGTESVKSILRHNLDFFKKAWLRKQCLHFRTPRPGISPRFHVASKLIFSQTWWTNNLQFKCSSLQNIGVLKCLFISLHCSNKRFTVLRRKKADTET